MGSLFEIAKSGIQAYRQALSVTGQNITNVNTEGYSKRDVSLQEIGGIQGGVTDVSDQSGLGVRVDEIRRSFNAYMNERLRSSQSSYEQINQFSTEISNLENNLYEIQLDYYYLSSPDNISKKILEYGNGEYSSIKYSEIYIRKEKGEQPQTQRS